MHCYFTIMNVEEFIKRLEEILEYYSMSASAFADKIGVQRSGLSHLLSGRNKPSLDFIMKITDSYPEINLYWLLNGEGSFLKSNTSVVPPATPSIIENNTEVNLFSEEKIIQETSSEKKQTTEKITESTIVEKKAIEQIVIFYKDGTFKNFFP